MTADDLVVVSGNQRAIPGGKVAPQVTTITAPPRPPPPRQVVTAPAQPMISKFFIDRPVLANVLAIVIVLIGAVALFALPVAQYPNVVPPTVSGHHPLSRRQRADRDEHGGPADRAAGQRRAGHALHAVDQRVSDGTYSLTVTFEIGTDLNFAQVLVQNRVSRARWRRCRRRCRRRA